MQVQADVYASGKSPVELKLLVKTKDGKLLLGKSQSIAPGIWHRDMVFTLAPEQIAQVQRAQLSCRSFGFEFTASKRARGLLLVDQIRVAPQAIVVQDAGVLLMDGDGFREVL